jgi:AcrR family transcriptional regulator
VNPATTDWLTHYGVSVTRSPASKLIPKVAKVSSRRQHYSDSTKRALVDVAEELFTEHGYAATSLDAIVAGADVTKGALYHHFSGKQAVFEAVFERIDGRCSKAIHQATSAVKGDPWAMAIAGLRTFLDIVQEPSYRRVVIQDGPSVLGYERFREQEERSTYANVAEIVRTVLHVGEWDLDEAMVETFTQIFFGALSAAGGSVAQSDEPGATAARVETAIMLLLNGLQALAEQGAGLPEATPEHGPGA